jgi:hypothetical protein
VPDVTEEPQSTRGKRIVLCFDGTANQIGAGNLTNVAKLFEMLEKNDPASQLSYYDPGVGTLAPAAAHSAVHRKLSLLIEQAFGLGLKNNVAQAYRARRTCCRMGSKSTPSTGISPRPSTTTGQSSPARFAGTPTASRCFPPCVKTARIRCGITRYR